MNVEHDQPRAAVVIIAYNDESHIERAIQSACNQTERNIEIICVDDGSTDATCERMRRSAERDERIKVVTQPNSGIFGARYAGLRHVTSDYVLYLDSDDVLMPDAVETACGAAEKTGADVLEFGVLLVQDENNPPSQETWTFLKRYFSQSQPLPKSDHGPELVNACFAEKSITWNACSKLHRTELLQKAFRFYQGEWICMEEDMLLTLMVLCQARRYARIAAKLYAYTIGGGMATTAEKLTSTQALKRAGAEGLTLKLAREWLNKLGCAQDEFMSGMDALTSFIRECIINNMLNRVAEEKRGEYLDLLSQNCEINEYFDLISEAISRQQGHIRQLEAQNGTRQDQSALYAANLYFDYGEGYNQKNSVSATYDASRFVDFTASIPDGTKAVRLDMVEGCFCVIKNLELITDRGALSYRNINGLSFEWLEVFCTTDPQIEICLSPGITWLRIRADVFVISDTRLFSEMQSVVHTEKQKFDNLRGALAQTETERDDLRGALAQTETERDDLRGALTQTETERDNLRDSLAQTETERDDLRGALAQTETERDDLRGALTQTETERDDLRGALKQTEIERDGLRDQLRQITAQAEELNARLLNVSQSFDIISNSHTWRATRPIRVVLDSVKTIPFFNLSIKGLKSLKANGIAFTWRKIRRWEDSKKYIETTNDEGSNKNIVLYESDYQANQDYSIYTTDIKMLAFYLPQYHTFPENDAWWGTGFTEWTNVKKSVPRFEGHYQPRVPHADIGYYCLEDIEVMRKQAALAKQHGIYGFCFYYYWFSGKRLMEKPVDQLLEHPEIDIPFCLCWANENWTRRWDGQDQDVLIKQNYTDEDDEQFIIDIKKYVDDPRYIRVDEAPVIIIYNPTAMPDCRKSFTKWRETARRIGVGEIKIWICLTWGRDAEMLRISDLVDAEVEFPPHNIGGDWMELKDIKREGRDCIIYDYYRGVEYIIGTWERNGNTLLPRHYTCMLAWDNSARRRDGWHAFYHFSLKEFYRWLTEAVRQSRAHLRPEERFIFVNAWNEWGEGTYLEPEEKYGYANINTLSKAIFDLPFDSNTTVITDDFPTGKLDEGNDSGTPKIAVQAHVFFLDLADEMIEYFNHIPYRFDLYITTDQEEKKNELLRKFESRCHCENVQVLVLENRGRDVAPLLIQLSPVLNRYEYIGHFHSKKTVTAEYGEDWRKYLFHNLLGSKAYVERVFGLFETQKDLGVVFPELFPPIREHAKWNGENEGIHALLARMDCDCELPEQLMFPAGNMFWARTEAVKPLFELGLTQADFPEESGQRYATIAHQIERSWAYIAQAKGFTSEYIMNGVKNEREI